jgi:hypothetical protein
MDMEEFNYKKNARTRLYVWQDGAGGSTFQWTGVPSDFTESPFLHMSTAGGGGFMLTEAGPEIKKSAERAIARLQDKGIDAHLMWMKSPHVVEEENEVVRRASDAQLMWMKSPHVVEEENEVVFRRASPPYRYTDEGAREQLIDHIGDWFFGGDVGALLRLIAVDAGIQFESKNAAIMVTTVAELDVEGPTLVQYDLNDDNDRKDIASELRQQVKNASPAQIAAYIVLEHY